MSPRRQVRVAVQDAYGEVANCYPSVCSVTGPPPAAPWAILLADTGGAYRLVCFDLDAGRGGDAEADARRLQGMLTRVGIDHVVCVSGPTGGHHAWLALAEPAPASLVAALARSASLTLRSLDIAPLCNPATGCVRPPGAPHRLGGSSAVVVGDVRCLLSPTTTLAQLEVLLTDLTTSESGGRPRDPVRSSGVPLDDEGRPWLPGVRRQLPPAAARAVGLRSAVTGVDLSQVLATVLVGAARSHWRYADVAAELANNPGLEHVRTARVGAGRRPRSAREEAAVLKRQWARCVAYAAAVPAPGGADPTFDPRAGALAGLVEAVQGRADAGAGRWIRGTGGGDRRVLDALCLLTLAGVRSEVEVDVRRLALLCGIGRETARTALHRLAADGWIRNVKPPADRQAATWALQPAGLSTGVVDGDRSQAAPPRGAACDRDYWLTLLERRLGRGRHDVFCGRRGLGFVAGNVYARLDECGPVGERADAPDVQAAINRLESHGLVFPTDRGWKPPPPEYLGVAAARQGVTGVLDARRQRYAIERELWAWWQHELTWMRRPRQTRGRRPQPGQLSLDGATIRHGPHPRRRDGRADYRTARAQLDARTTRDGSSPRLGPAPPAAA